MGRRQSDSPIELLFDLLKELFTLVPPWLSVPFAAAGYVGVTWWWKLKITVPEWASFGHWIGGFVAFIFLAAGFHGWWARRGRSVRDGSALKNSGLIVYESRKTLLTPCELNFFRVLDQSVPKHVWIASKVRLSDVIESKHGRRDFNRISQKHLDFVLCDRRTSQILSVIELNDSSHNSYDRGVRDSNIEEWLSSAGVKLVWVKATESYRPEELRRQLGFKEEAEPVFDPDAKYKPKLNV